MPNECQNPSDLSQYRALWLAVSLASMAHGHLFSKTKKTLPGKPHKDLAKAGEAPLPQCHARLSPSVFYPGFLAALVAPFSSSYPRALRF